MSSFTIRISGNPVNISLVLNKMDAVNANEKYPLYCLDGYHFEDVLASCTVGEVNDITINGLVRYGFRGSLIE